MEILGFAYFGQPEFAFENIYMIFTLDFFCGDFFIFFETVEHFSSLLKTSILTVFFRIKSKLQMCYNGLSNSATRPICTINAIYCSNKTSVIFFGAHRHFSFISKSLQSFWCYKKAFLFSHHRQHSHNRTLSSNLLKEYYPFLVHISRWLATFTHTHTENHIHKRATYETSDFARKIYFCAKPSRIQTALREYTVDK